MLGRADNVADRLGYFAHMVIEGNCCQCYCRCCILDWWWHTVPFPQLQDFGLDIVAATAHLLEPAHNQLVAAEDRPWMEEVQEEFSCYRRRVRFAHAVQQAGHRLRAVSHRRLCVPLPLPSSSLSILCEFP
jgi:hypothetical protein